MKGTARSSRRNAIVRRGRRVTLFVSYAHQNRVWMQRLQPVFVAMQYDDRGSNLVGLDEVSTWHDHELQPGDQWDNEIGTALDTMDIFVPLVSMDFFASWYVMNVELPKAMERHKRREIHVVPILLHDVNLREKCTFLNQFSPLPAWGEWWSSYKPQANALRPIDDGLWVAIQKVLDGQRP